MIPFYQAPDRVRYHGIAWDNGTIWQVVGNDSKRYSEYRPCLVRYDAATGKVLETVDFVPNSCDPHGLAMHDGKLISCDAGIHPGWPNTIVPPRAGSSKSTSSDSLRLAYCRRLHFRCVRRRNPMQPPVQERVGFPAPSILCGPSKRATRLFSAMPSA